MRSEHEECRRRKWKALYSHTSSKPMQMANSFMAVINVVAMFITLILDDRCRCFSASSFSRHEVCLFADNLYRSDITEV